MNFEVEGFLPKDIKQLANYTKLDTTKHLRR